MIANYTHFAEWTENTYEFGMLRALPSFLIGIYIAEIHHKKPFNLPQLPLGLALFCLSALLIYVAVPRIFVLICFAVTIYVTACGEVRGEKSLLMRPICNALGDASYSIYMLHIFCALIVNQALKNYLSPLAVAWCIMGFTVIVSLFSYRYFEKPIQAWMRGLYSWINVTRAADSILKTSK